jgi:hypothetical protein
VGGIDVGGDQVVSETKNFQMGPRAFETFKAVAAGPVQTALGDDLLRRLFIHLWRLRKTKRISRSVVAALIEKLSTYPGDIIRRGVEIYVVDHPEKGERYLVGICRTNSKIRGRDAAATVGARSALRGRATVGLPSAAKHLESVVLWLRAMYGDETIRTHPLAQPSGVPHRFATVTAVQSGDIIEAAGVVVAALWVRTLTDVDCPSAVEVDEIATDAEVYVRENVPKNIDVPAFSPYHI